jgi:hypothetical protein
MVKADLLGGEKAEGGQQGKNERLMCMKSLI